MGYNQTKMANIRPKWPELDQIICKKLRIKVKIDLIGQNQPKIFNIDIIVHNQLIKVKIDLMGRIFHKKENHDQKCQFSTLLAY